MAVAWVSSGTVSAAGTTTTTPGLPASLATGDGVLIQVICKPDTATIVTPTGWTLIANVSGGGGTTGNGTGPSQQSWFFREKDATWSTMPTITVTGGTRAMSIAHRYTKTATIWDIAGATGVYGTSAAVTNAAVTLGSNPGLTAGDIVIGSYTAQAGTGTIFSAESFAATGVSAWGAVSADVETLTSATNPQVGSVHFRGSVTTGTSSANPTMAATASTATRGTAALIRLREITITSKSGTDGAAITVTESSVKRDGVFVGGGGGNPRVAMVVDDIGGATPSANDIIMRDILVANSMTVTYLSEVNAPPSDTSTYDVVVHTESGSSTGTAITAYPTMAVPLVFLETSWNNIRMTSTAATNPTSTTQYDIVNTTTSIEDGLPDPLTWRTGASGNYGVDTSTLPAGVTTIATPVGNATWATVAVADTGATLTTGTAPARRVVSGIGVGSAPAAWTADANTLFINMVRWAANVSGGTWIFPDPVSASDSGSIAVADASSVSIITLVTKSASDGGSIAVADSGSAVPVSPLPAHIDGVEVETHVRLGVIQDSNGALYRITESNLADLNQPKAMKSTDNGATWVEQNAAGRPGTDTAGVGDLESGHVTWNAATKTITFTWQRSYVAYAQFRTSDHATNPDTWVSNTRENMASVTPGVPQYASHTTPTNQSYEWVFWSTTTQPQYRSRTSSGTYGTITNLDTTGGYPAAVIDASNDSWVIYKKSSQMHYKKLTSAGTLDSASTRIDTSGVADAAGYVVPHAAPVCYTNGGNTVVSVMFANASEQVRVVDIVNGTPGAEQTVTTSTVAANEGDTVSEQAILTLTVDGDTLHAIWVDATSWDIMYSSRPYGGAWTTPSTLLTTGVGVEVAYVDASIITRSGANYLAYTYDIGPHLDDASDIRYNELQVSTAAEPISGSDSAAITVSDSSALAITDAKSATDSAAITVTETSAVFKTIPVTDSSAITVTESAVTQVTQSATDTTAISVADNSSVLVSDTKSASDSAAISVADASSLSQANAVTATDTSAVTLTETATIFRALSAVDTTAITVVDSSASALSVSTVDSGALSVNDVGSVSITIATSDTGALSVSEVSNVASSLPGTETVAVSVTETASTFVTLSATDTSALSVADASATLNFVNTTDAGSISVTETAVVFQARSATDTAAITATDASAGITGINTLSATDTAAITITETRTTNVSVSRTDTAAISVAEAVGQAGSQPGTDAAAISVSETAVVFQTRTATDAASISVADVSALAILAPKSASDTAALTVTESPSILVGVQSADISALSVSESVSENVSVNANDSAAISVNESTTIAVTFTRTDTASISVTESAQVAIGVESKSANDTGALGITESVTTLVLITSYDSGSIAAGEGGASGGTFAAADTMSLNVVETASLQISTSSDDTLVISLDETVEVGDSRSADDSATIAVAETSDVLARTVNKVFVYVYQNGTWVDGTPVVWKNGAWRPALVLARKNGEWIDNDQGI